MLNKLGQILLVTIVVVSCAKEKSYETVYKEVELQKVADFNTDKEYMYVPMTLGTPREIKLIKPFYQGDEKLVRLEWSEEGLNVLEVEKDERFQDNPLNDTPVLTIPGEFSSYQCKEDEFGDCTNEEEENKELTWDQKEYFLPDYADIKVRELNNLDFYGNNDNACMTTKDTKVVNYEVSDGVINIEIEKTFRMSLSIDCLWDNYVSDNFSFNAFKTRYHYSLVEIDKLASPDYKPISYPIPDHDEFGFFKSSKTTLEQNYDRQRAKQEFFVNRFNPNQPNGELVYYLSKSFNKPENKTFKQATYDGVDVINKGLAAANVPFKMVVKEQSADQTISPGDLRYNMIVLIDDPLAGGLLGYGPSVKNPRTGEILKAHTNMYGGVLASIARSTYESAVDVMLEQKLSKEVANGVVKDKTGDFKVLPSVYKDELPETLLENFADSFASKEENEQVNKESAVNFDTENLIETPRALTEVSIHELQVKLKERLLSKRNFKEEYTQMLEGNFDGVDEFEKHEFLKKKEKGILNVHTEHKHEPEFFPIGGTVKVVFPALLKVKGVLTKENTLKRWKLLTEEQKKEILDIILYNSYLGTFIHEIGHNLGLRHNFAGSFDADNFYTKDDVQLSV